MNRKSLIMVLFAAVSVSLLAGCNDDGLTNGNLSAVITTQVNSGGFLEPWNGAVIEGDEIYGNPPCNESTDTSCLTDFSGVTSGQGTFTAFTDALPDSWNIAASNSNGTDTCPSQGALFNGTLTTDGITMVCGQTALGNATISPSICTSGGTQNTCPATVTLTLSSATIPMSHAMTVSAFSSTAVNIGNNTAMPSSPTVITVPTPEPSQYINGVAYVVMNVIDPTTNTVTASGFMTFELPNSACPPPSPENAVTPNAACNPPK